jgi:hypothetical protein
LFVLCSAFFHGKKNTMSTLFASKLNAAKPLFKLSDTLSAHQFTEMQMAADDKAVLSPLQARKTERYAPHVNHAIRMAARLAKFDIDPDSDRRVSITALDKALKEADPPLSISDRYELKACLGAAGIL